MPRLRAGHIGGIKGSCVFKVSPAQIGFGPVGPAHDRNFGVSVEFLKRGLDFASCLMVSAFAFWAFSSSHTAQDRSISRSCCARNTR